MTRKDFIAGTSAFLTVGPHAAFAKPRTRECLRLGMVSDLHLLSRETGKGVQNTLCFEPALRYFDSRKADAVIVCGDITDFGTKAMLRRFHDIWLKVFPGGRRSDGQPITLLPIYGDHDMGGYMHKFDWAKVHCILPGELDEIIADGDNAGKFWKEVFGEEWAPIQTKEVKGFKFILAHHPLHESATEKGNTIPGLADYMKKQKIDGKRPFFYIQHRIFRGILATQGEQATHWDSGKQKPVLDKYPNCIALCGHGHRNCVDELNLWQGEFTAIEVPSLNYCCTRTGHENGYFGWDVPDLIMPKANVRKSWQGMFGILYEDRFVVERRDFLHGEKLAPDWIIPLPKDGSMGFEARKRRAMAPQFAADAKVVVTEGRVTNREKVTTDAVIVSFPPAHSTTKTPRAYDYEVIARQGGKTVKTRYCFSKAQFWVERADTDPVECAIAKKDLPLDWKESVTFAVVPRDSFGNRGKAIS